MAKKCFNILYQKLCVGGGGAWLNIIQIIVIKHKRQFITDILDVENIYDCLIFLTKLIG